MKTNSKIEQTMKLLYSLANDKCSVRIRLKNEWDNGECIACISFCTEPVTEIPMSPALHHNGNTEQCFWGRVSIALIL